MKVYFMTRVVRDRQCLLLATPNQLKHSTDRAVIDMAIRNTANPDKYGVLVVDVPGELL